MLNKVMLYALAILGFGSDIVTVTSGTAGNVGSTAAELITYMSAKMLDVAELKVVLDQFGEKVPLPSNSSKTIRFTREEKFTVSASPTQLTEGVSPDADGITINQYEAITEQYGKIVRISDLAELTARHNIIAKTIYVLGLHAAETYDQLIFSVLDAASNTYRPNNRAADTNLIGSDLIGYNDLVELNALLMDQGSRPIDGTDYAFITPPQVYAGLLKDPDYKAAHQLAKPDAIWRGEVDELAGFRIVKTNAPSFASDAQATSGQSSLVYSSFALGRNAYQISDLQNLRMYTAAPGGQTDTLEQSRKIGYKFAFKSVITNQNWIRRVRSSGLNSVTNP